MSAGGRSRAAALALLAGVIAIAGAAIVVPAALHWSKTGAIIEAARSKVQQADRRNDARDALSNRLVEWDEFVATRNSGFILEATDEAAAAATENRIKELFERFGGKVSTLNTQSDHGPRDGVRSVIFSVDGSLARTRLGEFLTALESDPPFIIVSEFSANETNDDRLRISVKGHSYRLLEPGT